MRVIYYIIPTIISIVYVTTKYLVFFCVLACALCNISQVLAAWGDVDGCGLPLLLVWVDADAAADVFVLWLCVCCDGDGL